MDFYRQVSGAIGLGNNNVIVGEDGLKGGKRRTVPFCGEGILDGIEGGGGSGGAMCKDVVIGKNVVGAVVNQVGRGDFCGGGN